MMYRYAVIAGPGMYGSGSTVYTVYRTDDLQRAKKKAAALTASYRSVMRRYGGTSGFYRVIEWGERGRCVGLGHDADRIVSVD